jgi:predicted O-linked N-acetylglucosamine transferase (SPINDLY family)
LQPQAIFKQAQQLHQQGQYAQAENLYRQILRNAPYHAETIHLLGIACTQQGKHEEAITWLQKAIKKQPVQPVFYNNLGLVYAKLQMWEQAIECYNVVTKLSKNFPDVWFNMANVFKAQYKVEQAIEYYKKAIKFSPNHTKAMYNLGNILLETGKMRSAREWYEKVVAIQPDYAEAHNNLGSALEAWNEYELALNHYQKSVEIKPDFIEGIKNLANAYLRRGDYEKGKSLLQSIIDDKKSTGWEDLMLASLTPVIYESGQAIDDYLEQLEQTLEHYTQCRFPLDIASLHDQRLEIASGLPYLGSDLTPIQSLYGKIFSRALPRVPLNQNKNDHNVKPHIGFVVTNGHEGVFMKCMAGIINHFDTLRFEVTIVCSFPNGQEKLQPAITNSGVRFLSIPKQLDHAVHLLMKSNFDALHYWEVGTDYQNYFLPFFRIAPIQCATWGWPVTTGIPTIDYFLSCELLETEAADTHYTEKLIRFKKLPTYYLRPPVPTELESLSTFGLPTDVPIYLCAQNLRKIHPHFDYLVSAILRRDEKGYIVFIHDAQPNVTHLLQARLRKICGSNFDRIVFLERMSEERYLNLVAKVHVILDTLYYTGGANTAYDAIAAGTPYITLPWDFHRGRYGAAAYQQIGVEEAIATDLGDYVTKAIRIANEATYRETLSQKILSNAHKVFEDVEAVRELEQFFLEKIQKVKEAIAG